MAGGVFGGRPGGSHSRYLLFSILGAPSFTPEEILSFHFFKIICLIIFLQINCNTYQAVG